MGFLARFDEFHEAAIAAVGAEDFGSEDYREPMRRLLSDYDSHCRFTPVGLQMIAGEIIGRLIGRLMTERALKERPEAAGGAIVRPLVIFGMPRTGTTTLHRILAQDPALQTMPMWLGVTPMKRPARETWDANPWFRQTAAALEQGYALDPDIRSLHPIEAAEPDECRFAIDHSFWAPDCTSTANVPDYNDWVLGCDARFAFRQYRRALQVIGEGDGRRWLLKDVDHLFGLDSLIAEFPDACFIQTHRDPTTALTSVTSLIYRLRRLREEGLSPEAHGKHVLATWAAATGKAERVRRRHDPSRFIDVHNDAIHSDPIGTAERIYAHFGIPVTEAARAAWGARIAAEPTGGHGVHRYSPADFGFTRAIVDDAVGEYRTRYGEVAASAV